MADPAPPAHRTIADLTWPVRTERLSLRQAEQRDALACFAYRSLPEVTQWMTIHATDPEAWETEFAARLAHTLVIEKGGVVIGDLMLQVQDPWAQAEVREQAAGTLVEIGYVLDRRTPGWAGHRGRGRAAPAELRGARRASGDRAVLRGQRGVVAADGAGSVCAASSTPSRTRCTATASGWTG